MKWFALLFGLVAFLTPTASLADDSAAGAPGFAYTLAELEELVDASPQVQLLTAKQEETRRKESIWHDISVSAGFNPVRTADQFTDRIRAGFAVSMPLDILLFRDTARVSREVEGMELQKMQGDLKRELRRLWYERQRRVIEIRQMDAELGLARLQVQKVSTLLVAQDASLDTVKEAEVAVSRIEATITSKQIDVRDLEDGMLALVGKPQQTASSIIPFLVLGPAGLDGGVSWLTPSTFSSLMSRHLL